MDALCRAFADDYEAGGIVAGLVSDWPTNPRKDALALRLAGCLHHATLTGRAPALAAAYPARQPDWSMQAVWPLARTWLAENEDWVRAFLESAPQTNETRRCIALLPGFLELAHRFDMPMHLMELGASAGLNQNWDRYAYETGSWHWPPMRHAASRFRLIGRPARPATWMRSLRLRAGRPATSRHSTSVTQTRSCV